MKIRVFENEFEKEFQRKLYINYGLKIVVGSSSLEHSDNNL